MSSSLVIPEKRPKVVVFDVDETLGCFSQFGIFFEALGEYFNNPNLGYLHFNALIDLYPEVFRTNIVRILEYIRKKKQSGVCSKVMIYTNNQGPAKWVQHIRGYLEKKLAEAGALTTPATAATTTPLFDRIIGGFKISNANNELEHLQRATQEKTVNDFLRCSRLSANIEICFLDDVLHQKMVDEKVYYIRLQSYNSYIPFEQYITRFINSKLYDQHFSELHLSRMGYASNKLVYKQTTAIELNNIIMKRAKMSQYDAKKVLSKVNPREIDEIISKYILYHLQLFFKDARPLSEPASASASASASARNKTRKVSSANISSSKTGKNRIFDVNKDTAVNAYKLENQVRKTLKKRIR
jgi:hypothetical protein